MFNRCSSLWTIDVFCVRAPVPRWTNVAWIHLHRHVPLGRIIQLVRHGKNTGCSPIPNLNNENLNKAPKQYIYIYIILNDMYIYIYLIPFPKALRLYSTRNPRNRTKNSCRPGRIGPLPSVLKLQLPSSSQRPRGLYPNFKGIWVLGLAHNLWSQFQKVCGDIRGPLRN